jgi:PadR family transcriptional regulator, regulatory protein PadR
MAQQRSASTQAKALLTLMLARRSHWLHGYELSEQVGLKSGTLYPILMRLSDRGVLESKWEPSPHEGRPPRRLYRLTALGVSYAKEQITQVRAVMRLASLGQA